MARKGMGSDSMGVSGTISLSVRITLSPLSSELVLRVKSSKLTTSRRVSENSHSFTSANWPKQYIPPMSEPMEAPATAVMW